MIPWWLALLEEQRRVAFADLAGTRADLLVPVSDTLLTRIAAERLPSTWPVRELTLNALEQNALAVRVRLSRPAFLPAITVRLVIERQPVLPDAPVLVLRLVREGLAALAAPFMKFVAGLPPFVRFDGERLFVDVRGLASHYRLEPWLDVLASLEVTTAPGRVVVAVRAALPPPAPVRSGGGVAG